MFDESGGAPRFDFDEIADYLLEQGAEVSPAQIHGCLSGLLAGGAIEEDEHGLYAVNVALEVELHGELAALVMQLYRSTAAALADEEFGFYPLLPGEEAGVEARTAATAGWCRGFLAGMSRAGDRQWSAEGREVLEDVAEIARAEVGDEQAEDEADRDLTEVVEYLRFAVMNLFAESAASADSRHGADVTRH